MNQSDNKGRSPKRTEGSSGRAREWWIEPEITGSWSDDDHEYQCSNAYEFAMPNAVHVIEKSVYLAVCQALKTTVDEREALQAENERLKENLEKYIDNTMTHEGKLRDELAETRANLEYQTTCAKSWNDRALKAEKELSNIADVMKQQDVLIEKSFDFISKCHVWFVRYNDNGHASAANELLIEIRKFREKK